MRRFLLLGLGAGWAAAQVSIEGMPDCAVSCATTVDPDSCSRAESQCPCYSDNVFLSLRDCMQSDCRGKDEDFRKGVNLFNSYCMALLDGVSTALPVWTSVTSVSTNAIASLTEAASVGALSVATTTSRSASSSGSRTSTQTTDPTTSSPPPADGGSSGLSMGAKMGLAVGIPVGVLILAAIIGAFCFARRRAKKHEKSISPEPNANEYMSIDRSDQYQYQGNEMDGLETGKHELHAHQTPLEMPEMTEGRAHEMSAQARTFELPAKNREYELPAKNEGYRRY